MGVLHDALMKASRLACMGMLHDALERFPVGRQVEMLVNVGGADVFVRDRWKATPADEAQRVESATVSAFLQQAQQAAGKQPQHVTQDG